MNRNLMRNGLVLSVSLLVLIGGVQAQKRVQAFKAQTTYTFVNSEGQDAHGLIVTLSNQAEVVLDPDSGHAGPFRDIRGNDSPKIVLSNPATPIAPGGDGFELTFGTYRSKIKVTKWWWTDAKGKPLGAKKKG